MLVNWDVVTPYFRSNSVKCHNGTSQNRCVSNIELITILLEELSSELSLTDAIRSESNVSPASEAIFLIPCRFTVSKEHDLVDLFNAVLLHLDL